MAISPVHIYMNIVDELKTWGIPILYFKFWPYASSM